jgi:hypothetical protein
MGPRTVRCAEDCLFGMAISHRREAHIYTSPFYLLATFSKAAVVVVAVVVADAERKLYRRFVLPTSQASWSLEFIRFPPVRRTTAVWIVSNAILPR